MEKVVVLSEESLVVENTSTERVIAESTNTVLADRNIGVVVVSGIMGPRGVSGLDNISNAGDVDASQRTNGSILVYDSSNQKWTATTTLSEQRLDAGQY